MRTSSVGLVVTILFHASLAVGQPSGAPSPAPPAVQPTAEAAEPHVEAGIRDDAASGRTWLSPTALTPPAGTFSAQSVQILFAGASFSPTDRLAISVNTVMPLPGVGWVVLGGIKLKVAELGRLKLAAHLSLTYVDSYVVSDDGDGREEPGEREDVHGGLAILGGVATLCLDGGCHSFLNAYLSSGGSVEADAGVDVPINVFGSLAWIQRLAGRFKLAFELFSITENDADVGVFGWYGMRYARRSFAMDAGMVRVFCEGCGDVEGLEVLGAPWLAFTFRAL